MSKKGFTAFDLAAAVNDPNTTPRPTKPKTKPTQPAKKVAKEDRVQRAIYFPKDIDEALRQWAFEDNTQITKIVVEAVRAYGKRRK